MAARMLAGSVSETPVSFRNDIVPILSKANCNSGGCHGALAGKGGFRLSLFGYNPEADYLSITREAQGRRVEVSQPGLSLLLTKPTTTVRHKGGKRLEVDSDDYRTLARWIAEGAPGPKAGEAELRTLVIDPGERSVRVGETLTLTVKARFSDGRERDVTRWAKFTSTDETVAWLTAQAAELPHVRLIQQSHGGPAQGRNRGVEKARGEVIVFIDSDLVVTPTFLSCHGKALERHWQLAGPPAQHPSGTACQWASASSCWTRSGPPGPPGLHRTSSEVGGRRSEVSVPI
jgi:hypothetical protein